MGHLFRTIHLSRRMKELGWPYMVMINHYAPALFILQQQKIPFETVNFLDHSCWELDLIKRYGVSIWVNDRLNTDEKHATTIKMSGVRLVTFDDRGGGAGLADLHFAALCFSDPVQLQGARVLTGLDYLILNPEIEAYRRLRTVSKSIVVSLGGTDTYGVSIKVLDALAKRKKGATLILGPGFEHMDQLKSVDMNKVLVKINVDSLAKEFFKHDLAVTGGGLTPFEANAAGLPCIVVANEHFEKEVGLFLDQLGSSVFAGHYTAMNMDFLDHNLDIMSMSHAGMNRIRLDGAINVCREIGKIWDA